MPPFGQRRARRIGQCGRALGSRAGGRCRHLARCADPSQFRGCTDLSRLAGVDIPSRPAGIDIPSRRHLKRRVRRSDRAVYCRGAHQARFDFAPAA